MPGEGARSLSDLAKASAQVFAYISYVQLGMICLLAPVFCAAAITQERDAQTYNILLATPLTNLQIVLGSLFSRLYYIVALLLSGVPVFAITLFYGGVTAGAISTSFAIAMSTAFFTGSLAIAIAVFRLGSGKTVFWFYVFNAIYLVGIFLIDVNISGTGGTGPAQTTWLTGIHPFLALQSVVSPSSYVTPDPTSLTDTWWGVRWYLAYPAQAYIAITSIASLLLVGPSAIVLRRIAQRSEVGLWSFVRNILMRGKEARGRKSRTVWNNPVAWREAATRAGFSGRGIARWTTISVGLSAAAVILYFYHAGKLDVAATRRFLMGLFVVEFSVALLVATNTSASAVTRERESQTLDLLLVTPITSRYYLWGKLRGLVSFMLPFAALPTLTVLVVILYDVAVGTALGMSKETVMGFVPPSPTPVQLVGFWQRFNSREWVVWPETLISLPLLLTAMMAWACMLGLQLSLKWSKTIVAVMASVGMLAGICSLLGLCGFTAASHVKGFGLFVAAFSPFTAICVMINPQEYAAESFGATGMFNPASTDAYPESIGRAILFISILMAIAAYCLLVWTMYRSMVKNFDMIIRRQHS